MPKDNQHITFLNNYFNSLLNPDILTETTKQTAIRCNAAHIPPTTSGVDGVDSQIVGRHISECRRRARNQPRAERIQQWQLAILQAAYAVDHYPSPGERMKLMYQTGMSYRQIKNWFEQKAKMLKKSGGGPVGSTSSSNKYSTKMWKAYFANPLGYVQKLLNGEIDPVTGAVIGQAAPGLPNAPANGPANSINGNNGLVALAPGTTVVPNLDNQSGYQNGEGGFSNLQPPPQSQMYQYGQPGSPDTQPAAPYIEVNQQAQPENSNLQAPPHYQAPQQKQHGPQQIPMYTREQNVVYTMPPTQSTNSGISSYAAGRSYEVSRVQPAPQQEAYPGAYTADTISHDVAPALFDGIQQTLPYQHRYGMPVSSQSVIPCDPFANQDDNEEEYEEDWQRRHVPFYPPAAQGHAMQYMPVLPQASGIPMGQPFNGHVAQSNDPARKRKSTLDDDELNQGPYAAHLRKRPRQASGSRLFAPSATGNFAGAESRMADTRRPAKRLRAMRPTLKTRRRPMPGQSEIRRSSWSSTEDAMNSSFDNSGARWSPPEPSKLNICHGSPYEENTAELGMTSPNIRTPIIRTPDVRGSDVEPQPLDPLLFGYEQDGLNSGTEEVSGQLLEGFPTSTPTIGAENVGQYATENITERVAQQFNTTAPARTPSPAFEYPVSILDGDWEADSTAQDTQLQQDSAFLQGGTQELELSAEIPSVPENVLNTQDAENFENLLPVPDMNALEQSFLQNGEFDYSAFLGNESLFEHWDTPNLDNN
ncbi:hypothetical protein ACHAQE_006765 [Botrytis cinerea]